MCYFASLRSCGSHRRAGDVFSARLRLCGNGGARVALFVVADFAGGFGVLVHFWIRAQAEAVGSPLPLALGRHES